MCCEVSASPRIVNPLFNPAVDFTRPSGRRTQRRMVALSGLSFRRVAGSIGKRSHAIREVEVRCIYAVHRHLSEFSHYRSARFHTPTTPRHIWLANEYHFCPGVMLPSFFSGCRSSHCANEPFTLAKGGQ